MIRHYVVIDLFHNGGQVIYSFISMLISPGGLVSVCKIQKNFYSKMRPVGLINLDIKE